MESQSGEEFQNRRRSRDCSSFRKRRYPVLFAKAYIEKNRPGTVSPRAGKSSGGAEGQATAAASGGGGMKFFLPGRASKKTALGLRSPRVEGKLRRRRRPSDRRSFRNRQYKVLFAYFFFQEKVGQKGRPRPPVSFCTVSYTHLTLPTTSRV